jgi:hypothetical protein
LDAAQEVDVLPGQKQSLLNVNNMSEAGYTIVFHPGDEGETIHNKEGMIAITTIKPPILQGCKSNTAKLWMVSVETDKAIWCGACQCWAKTLNLLPF